MEIEKMEVQSNLDAAKQDVDNLTNLKASLKAKLKDYHTKLQTTVTRYEDQVHTIEQLNKKVEELQNKNEAKITENQAKQRRTTVTLNEQRQELEEARKNLEKTKDKKSDIEMDLKREKAERKVLEQNVEACKKEMTELRKSW